MLMIVYRLSIAANALTKQAGSKDGLKQCLYSHFSVLLTMARASQNNN